MMIHVDKEGDLQIIREYPSNGNSIELQVGKGMRMVFFLSKRDWWAMRNAFQRSREYFYVDYDRTNKSGEQAEIAAAAHYNEGL
jgi:hypothetical protein